MLDKTGKGKFTVPISLLQLRELSEEMMCGQTLACFPPDQDTEMLQTYSGLARIFNDARILCWHCISEGLERGQRRDLVGHVNDRKGRSRQARRADERVADLQGSATKAVFAMTSNLSSEGQGMTDTPAKKEMHPLSRRHCKE
jgi:hypothetical protein